MTKATQATLFGGSLPIEDKKRKRRSKSTAGKSSDDTAEERNGSPSPGPEGNSTLPGESSTESVSLVPADSSHPVPLYCEDFTPDGQRCGESPAALVVSKGGDFWAVCVWHKENGPKNRLFLKWIEGKGPPGEQSPSAAESSRKPSDTRSGKPHKPSRKKSR